MNKSDKIYASTMFACVIALVLRVFYFDRSLVFPVWQIITFIAIIAGILYVALIHILDENDCR